VLVDGPYGCLSIDLGDYSRLLLVGGGIGITPITSILAFVLEERRQHRLAHLEALRLVS
jgi:predicted ferric reductase